MHPCISYRLLYSFVTRVACESTYQRFLIGGLERAIESATITCRLYASFKKIRHCGCSIVLTLSKISALPSLEMHFEVISKRNSILYKFFYFFHPQVQYRKQELKLLFKGINLCLLMRSF